MPNKTKLYGLRSSEILISHFINEFEMPNKTKPYRLCLDILAYCQILKVSNLQECDLMKTPLK